MHYVFFITWLPSLNTVFSDSFMLLYTARVCSFLLLTSIPFYGCVTTGLFTHLGYFLFWTLPNKVAMNIYVESLYGHMFLALLGKYVGVKWLDLSSAFPETDKLFSKVAILSYIPTSSFNCSP